MGKCRFLLLCACIYALIVSANAFRQSSSHQSSSLQTKLSTFWAENHKRRLHKGVSLLSVGVGEAELTRQTINIPNCLTLARIAAVPVLTATHVSSLRAATWAVFVATSLTDYLDGYLARKWQMVTPLGQFLDPVADKLMVASTMILLTCQYPKPQFVIPVTVLVAREIGVSALREWMATRGARTVVAVGFTGKLKTATQMIALCLLLLACPGESKDFDLCSIFRFRKSAVLTSGFVALYLSAAASLVSGWQYFKAALPELLAYPTLTV